MRTATPRARKSRAAAFVLSALLAAVTSLSAACGGSSATVKTGALEKDVLKIGIVKGDIGALPVYIGLDQKLFAQQGITLEIDDSYPDDESVLQALKGNKVDLAFGDYARYFEAQALGQDRLSLIAEGYLAGPGSVNLVAPSNGSTPTLTDVEGAFSKGGILVPTTGNPDPGTNYSVPELMLATTLTALANNEKLDQSDVGQHFFPVPQSTMVKKLAAGPSTEAVMTEPYWSEASANNKLSVALDLTTGANDSMPMSGYFTLQDSALTYPNTFKAFTAALTQAKQAASVRATALTGLISHYGIPAPVATGISLGTFPVTVNVNRLDRVVVAMNAFGQAQFFDPSVIVPSGSVGMTGVSK